MKSKRDNCPDNVRKPAKTIIKGGLRFRLYTQRFLGTNMCSVSELTTAMELLCMRSKLFTLMVIAKSHCEFQLLNSTRWFQGNNSPFYLD